MTSAVVTHHGPGAGQPSRAGSIRPTAAKTALASEIKPAGIK